MSISRLHILVKLLFQMFHLDTVVTTINSIFSSFNLPCHCSVKSAWEVNNQYGEDMREVGGEQREVTLFFLDVKSLFSGLEN